MATPLVRLGPVTPSMLAQMKLAGARKDALSKGVGSALATSRTPKAAAAPRRQSSGPEQVVAADELDDKGRGGSAEPVEQHKRVRIQPPEEPVSTTPEPTNEEEDDDINLNVPESSQALVPLTGSVLPSASAVQQKPAAAKRTGGSAQACRFRQHHQAQAYGTIPRRHTINFQGFRFNGIPEISRDC